MRQIQFALGGALAAGRCVYVHCRMGIGRTGTVLGCYLAEQGQTGMAALDELNRAWQQCGRARRWPCDTGDRGTAAVCRRPGSRIRTADAASLG